MNDIYKSKKALIKELSELREKLGANPIALTNSKNLSGEDIYLDNFKQIVLNSPNAIFIVNTDGIITHWNKSCEKLFGYSEKIKGSNIYYLHPKSKDFNFSELFIKAKKGESFNDVEINYKNNSMEDIYFISRIYPIYDDQKEVISIVLANTDITKRRTSKTLEFMEDFHFKSLVENLSQVVFRTDTSGNLKYLNKIGLKKFNIEEKKFTKGINIEKFLDYENKLKFNNLSSNVLLKKEHSTDEIAYTISKNQMLETYTFLNPIIEYDEIIGFNAILTEIANIKLIENELKESEKKYRDLFNYNSDGIIYTNSKGIILDANPAFYKMTNLKPEDIKDKFALTLAKKFLSIKDIPRVISIIGSTLSGNTFENFIVNYSDRIFEVFPLSTEQKYGTAAIIRDITEITKSKRALEKSELEYKLVVENASEAIFVIKDDKIVFTNSTLNHIMGLSTEELGKSKFVEFIHHTTRNEAIKNYKLRLEGKSIPPKIHQINVKNKNIWVEFKGVKIDWEDEPAVLYFAKDITDQKTVQEALIESETRYRELVEHSPAGIYEIDLTTRKFSMVNDFMAEYTGYSKEELYNMPSEDLLTEDGKKEFLKKIKRLYNGEISTDVSEYQIIRKDRTTSWVLISVKFVLSEEKQIKARFIVHDISEKKNAEEKVLKYQRFLQSMLNSVPVILSCIDKNRILTWLEGKGLLDLDIDHQNLIGKNIDELLNDDFCIFDDFEQIHSGHRTTIISDTFGRTFETHFSNVKNSNGEIDYYIGISKDITDRAKYEEALVASEKKYRLLLESLNEGILVLDDEGITTYSNQQLADMLGYTQLEIIDNHFINFVDEESKVFALQFLNNQSKQSKIRYELTLNHKDGNKIYTIFESASIIDEDRNFFGSISGIIDITEKTKYQKELAESQELLNELNLSKDKFFSIIAHDLKSPLSGFLGLTKMLVEDFNSIPVNELKEFTGSLFESASNLNKLLENLLEWSRLQRGLVEVLPQNVDILNMINGIINIFKVNYEQKNIYIETNIESELIGFFDAPMIETAIRNIISNAIKFTRRNGRIYIYSIQIDPNNLQICIKDNGIGMSPEIQKKLFKIGEHISNLGTENESGSGLGLILCKELVERNNGKINVISKVNEGSEFCIILPIKNKKLP